MRTSVTRARRSTWERTSRRGMRLDHAPALQSLPELEQIGEQDVWRYVPFGRQSLHRRCHIGRLAEGLDHDRGGPVETVVTAGLQVESDGFLIELAIDDVLRHAHSQPVRRHPG